MRRFGLKKKFIHKRYKTLDTASSHFWLVDLVERSLQKRPFFIVTFLKKWCLINIMDSMLIFRAVLVISILSFAVAMFLLVLYLKEEQHRKKDKR